MYAWVIAPEARKLTEDDMFHAIECDHETGEWYSITPAFATSAQVRAELLRDYCVDDDLDEGIVRIVPVPVVAETREVEFALTDCGDQETQAHFDARMALGRQRRDAYVPPARDPFRKLPVTDDSPF